MQKSNHHIRFSLSDPLNDKDTEYQTYGCRHTNPEICGSCDLVGVCAFVTSDFICKKPSRQWKNHFKLLAEKDEG